MQENRREQQRKTKDFFHEIQEIKKKYKSVRDVEGSARPNILKNYTKET